MVYDLPLVEEKVKPHQVTSLHLICSLAFIGTGAIIFVYNYVITMWGLALLIAGFLLLGITIVRNRWLISRQVNFAFRIIELILALTIAGYSIYQGWKFPIGMFSVLSAAIIFSMYWERSQGNKLLIFIDNEGIKLPITSRKKFIPWVDVEQVVLRFGTLSVNCADNSLQQWNIAPHTHDPTLIETFCTTLIEEHRGKRRNDEW